MIYTIKDKIMYINTNNLLRLNEPLMLPLLLVLKHASKKDVSEVIPKVMLTDDPKDLDWLVDEGYIKYIKGKKEDNLLQKLRLDTKGKLFLNALQDPEVLEEDMQFCNWLITVYKDKGKTIKSGKKLLSLIAWFRESTQIDKNKLAYLLKCFIQEQEETDFKYSHDINNVFWKPTNLFQTRPILEDSRLYSFYISNKEKMDKEFEKY